MGGGAEWLDGDTERGLENETTQECTIWHMSVYVFF